MQIRIENEIGKQILPPCNGKYLLPHYNNRLCISLEEKENVHVFHGNSDLLLSKAGEHFLPLEWDSTNKCNMTIKQDEEVYNYHFQLENTKISEGDSIRNLYRFVSLMQDTFVPGESYHIDDLYSAIKEDKVSLIIEKTPYSGYDDQSLLKKISDTVPLVMDICSHPKKSLRSEEAVLDINLVKWINSRTMDHLASHSEHWKSRSLNGITPNRLRSDILEDEINIYENLFFRMAVNDVLKYVHMQVVSIEKTIQQNDSAIDWNAYGKSLSDYKRLRVFRQLLPDYNVNERKNKNKALRELLNRWKKLEKNYSTVEASQFYRSIDRKKRISRNIKPTNIIKKDSRYNALYRLWCDIQRQKVKEQNNISNLDGDGIVSVSDCYSMYVATLLLYVFKLMECEIDNSSSFTLSSDGNMKIHALFESRATRYIVESAKNKYGTIDIKIEFIEKIQYEYKLSPESLEFSEKIVKEISNYASLNLESGTLVFFARPSETEQRKLKNIFHLSNSAKKGMKDKLKYRIDDIDKIWRPKLEELFSSDKIRNPQKEIVIIKPQFIIPEDSENGIEKFTSMVLDSANPTTVFTFPIDIGDYRNVVNEPRIMSRLLNYGEKYFDGDAERWGNYQIGIVPVAQTEVNSAQRIMKLISIHTSRLIIKWNEDKVICPICGNGNCKEESNNSWKCNNSDCGVVFGITRHADGCGKTYEWTRPFVGMRKKDVIVGSYMDLMLRKEIIFDRLTITDFEFEEELDENIKYIPICPICGARPTTRKKAY